MPIQTIACQASVAFVAWKHPEDTIILGSQIVVNESQEALLFENGKLISILKPGRHLVESGNIPGLEGVMQRAFGGSSPLMVQVWFFNKAASFDYKWGVGIQIRDEEHNLLVPLGARGSYALRLRDAGSFIQQMVGVNSIYTTEEIRRNLMPVVERNLKDYIAQEIIRRKLDVYTLAAQIREISNGIKSTLTAELAIFGLELIDFYLQAIEIVSDDPAFTAIKQSLAEAAALRIRAKAASDVGNFYQLERSLDALNLAAANDGGPAGALLAGGLGVGLGLGAGQKMGDDVNRAVAQASTAPTSDIESRLRKLKNLLAASLISQDDYEARKSAILEEI